MFAIFIPTMLKLFDLTESIGIISIFGGGLGGRPGGGFSSTGAPQQQQQQPAVNTAEVQEGLRTLGVEVIYSSEKKEFTKKV